MEKYTISTTIYIYEDKPEYYLHGNRLQYVQSQNKQTETHRSFIFLEKSYSSMWTVPGMNGVIWQKYRF